MIVILDYGVGNVSSIANMLKKNSIPCIITKDFEELINAEKIILPGVGHFDFCMNQLLKAPFYETLELIAREGEKTILGICVGCQMLMENSEEGNEKGLGWIKGKVVKFDNKKMLFQNRIPHMGWCNIRPKQKSLFYQGINEPRFYFAHSYHVICEDERNVTATAEYGYEFAASIQFNNIMGVQFHPEKSHSFGMKLYSNFVNNNL